VGGEYDFPTSLDDGSNRRQGLDDPGIVRNLILVVQRDIVIHPDEHPFPFHFHLI
jgi:hypothetical protein